MKQASDIRKATDPDEVLFVIDAMIGQAAVETARAFQDLAKRSDVRMPVLPQPLTHADVNRTLGLPGDYTDAVDRFIVERLRR